MNLVAQPPTELTHKTNGLATDVQITHEKEEKLNESINKQFGHSLIYFNANLRMIASIQVNDKLFTENEYIGIHANGWVTSFVRRYYGYSRDDTCQTLETLINTSIDIYTHLNALINRNIKNKQAQLYTQIIRNESDQLKHNLINAKKGLTNLLTTYKDDLTTKTKIEVLLNKIDL
jgi:hypothetical protein